MEGERGSGFSPLSTHYVPKFLLFNFDKSTIVKYKNIMQGTESRCLIRDGLNT